MGRAIELRTDYTSEELRRLAKRGKDAAQTRRLLAIAAVLEGASRAEAAKAGGMDRQPATARPCSFISMRSPPRSRPAPTPCCCSIRPACQSASKIDPESACNFDPHQPWI